MREPGRVRVGMQTLLVVLHDWVEVEGASYKVVKTLALTGAREAGVELPQSELVSVSPLLDATSGRPLMEWVGGWRRSWPGEAGRARHRYRGEYLVRVGWAGEEGERAARALVKALTSTRLASVELYGAEVYMVDPEPLGAVELRLVTPAVIKARPPEGAQELVVAVPSVSRLFRAAMRAVYGDPADVFAASALLDFYTAQVAGEWRRVTVYVDSRRPTAWAVYGWARISVTGGAPDRVPVLLSHLARVASAVGVGKSRRDGFGVAEASAPAGPPP